jgi:protein O-mannosyl-transferase
MYRARKASPFTTPHLFVCLLLILAVALVFGGAVRNEFVNYDDDLLVYGNPVVAQGLTAHGIAWACTANVANMWYPLTLVSYMLDTQVFGTKPWGYHFTSVLLHAAASVLLFLVLRRATGTTWSSALVATLFAVHPLGTEAVEWVGERKSPLSGFFFVATIGAYFAFARRPLSILRYLATASLFTLGLLAKPTLVTLPCLLLLLDYWPLGRWQPARSGALASQSGEHSRKSESAFLLVLEKVPFFVLSIVCSVAAVRSQAGNIAPLQYLTVSTRIANALISYVIYVGEFFWPVGLAPFYPQSESHPAWQVAGALGLMAAISLAAVLAWRQLPALVVGWLWFLGTMLPTSGLVQIGSHARADRYMYLPQIGLGIAVVWTLRAGLERICGKGRVPRGSVSVAAALAVAALMACAWQQASYWRDSVRLWTHALACTCDNAVANLNLGMALAERGDIDAAIAQYRRVLAIRPDDAEALSNLGNVLCDRGQFDEAVASCRKAVEAKPGFAMAHNNLGVALVGRGDFDEAISQFREAMELKPDLASAHFNLGLALEHRGQLEPAIAQFRMVTDLTPAAVGGHFCLARAYAARGELDAAVVEYRKALDIEPDFLSAHINLGVVLDRRGEDDEAIVHYRRVLAIDPDYNEAHNNLGLILAKRGEVDAAAAHFRAAMKTRPDYLEARYNLGSLLAGAGRPAEALVQYRAALDLAVARKNRPLAGAIRARIEQLPH